MHDFSEHPNTSYFASITCNNISKDHEFENLVMRSPKQILLTHVLRAGGLRKEPCFKCFAEIHVECRAELPSAAPPSKGGPCGEKPARRCSLRTLCKAIVARLGLGCQFQALFVSLSGLIVPTKISRQALATFTTIRYNHSSQNCQVQSSICILWTRPRKEEFCKPFSGISLWPVLASEVP